MVDNGSFSLENNRLTAEHFNRFALFGREYPADEQPLSEPNFLMRPTNNSASEQPVWDCLIKLFIQGAILEAFISQYFPPICRDRPLQHFIEWKLDELLTQELHPSTTEDAISTLIWETQTAVKSISDNVSNGIGVDDDYLSISVRQEFIDACNKFIVSLREHLGKASSFLLNLKDDGPPTEDTVFNLVQFLQTEYEFGRSWASHFFICPSLRAARMYLKYSTDSDDQQGMIIQTLNNDEERYIQLTLPPRLFLNDIEKPALYFFHEYISHLSAGIYSRLISREQKKEVIKSYRGIPRQLDEGWMVHAAQTFFYEKRTRLLGTARQHLEQRILGNVNVWATNMFHPYIGKTYLRKAEFGSEIANRFLIFLRDQVCDGDQIQANNLYYRISFDLITHYPLFSKWHLSFITTLYHWQQKYQYKLVEIIKTCIKNVNGGYIDLVQLWESIEHDRPEPDLERSN
jgi:hypothetical protein